MAGTICWKTKKCSGRSVPSGPGPGALATPRARTACPFLSAPTLAPCCPVLPEPFESAAAFIRWQWPRSAQIMDPHQRPRETPHHWTLRNALHQATPSFASPTLGMLRGPSAHWHPGASPALAQESEGNCQDGAGPETTSVRTSQQIKAMMLLRRASGRRRWAKEACRQASVCCLEVR